MFKSTQLYSSPSNITRKFLSNNNRSTFDDSLLSDEYFNYVTMLLHGDGTNGAQNNTFIDSSSNNFTITRNGNTTQGTLSPFGDNWSNYLSSVTDRIYTGNSTAFALGTSDFCYEGWIYCDNPGAVSYPRFFGIGPFYNDVNSFGLIIRDLAVSNYIAVYFYDGTLGRKLSSTTTFPTSQWNHLAVVRSGSNYGLFLNGTRIATYTSSNSIGDGNATYGFVGGTGYDVEGFVGYASNVRLVKGSSVYDPTQTTITVPAAPLTAITNTQLLTCSSNRIADRSANAFALTTSGTISVQKFSPFSPTTSYNSSTVGGSLYFDGSGDTLTLSSNAAFALGTGDFTVEAWIYATTAANNFGIFNIGPASAGSYSLYWSSSTSKFESVRYGDLAGSGTTTNTYTINGTWTHIAAVRSSGTSKLFINGVEDAGSSYAMGNITNSSAEIGSIWQGAGTNQGYISNLRVIKGTALYTSNFTPSTTPLTNITNTSLLLNGTNAGIFDNAMKANLETVGNAQISTTQSKFGGSSMYFDGTGDAIVLPNSPITNLSIGDFTVECWVYYNSFVNDTKIYIDISDGANYWQWRYSTGNGLELSTSAVGTVCSQGSTSGWNTGTWYHVALVRNGSNFNIYRDGISIASGSTASSIGVYNARNIGGWSGSSSTSINGYIDDFRITKGFARYTTNFTPPTRAFPNK